MGAKKQKQEAFLAKHPFCCFCGGTVAATTRDHIPPRSVFVEKKWPVGYEFPACLACNNGSSRDDVLVAFLSRMNPGRDHTPQEEQEWLKLLAALREQFPGLTREMIISANEVRRWMRAHNLSKPVNVAYGEMPLIRIPPTIVDAVRRFNQKLLKALHYKHTGKVIPLSAWSRTKWWSNANLIAGEFPREIADIMPGRAVLQRGRVDLGGQFSYRYGTGDDGTLGAYLAAFQSFAVVGVVVFDASRMADKSEAADEAMDAAVDQAGSGTASDSPIP